MTWRQRPLPLLPPLLPPLGSVLSRLPAYPGSWLFARMLNASLAPQLAADTKAGLEGKLLRLRVSNLGIAFDVSWRKTGFAPSAPQATPDLAIAASLHDLWLLARREEDPDSLFFRRRLVLEGDTELGLLFKNAIDAFELGALDLFLRRLAPFSRHATPKDAA
ncbi:ubiquinone anaerobic biosynthesis accessory factor UbiT [Massilia sp. TWP1-3-3]|uniref:ubiquinone anaerobic biosynthesis accessory factor UbiT n=1 Tax=Massilia sp. TWP1-3-3 TaxID=2804573 RepID=UPI003CECDDDD